MNNPIVVMGLYFSMFLLQLPTMLACLAACIVILVRWKSAAGAASWALLGFGLLLIIGFVQPLVLMMMQIRTIQEGTLAGQMRVSSAFSMFWAVLRAIAYLALLVAIFTGRRTPSAANPPPLAPK
jgi:hypothetical protein